MELDFDMSTVMGGQIRDGTNTFASSRWWAKQNRTAMDDIESLVFTIWHIEHIHLNDPAGLTISKQSKDKNVAFVLVKRKKVIQYFFFKLMNFPFF